MKNTNYTNPLFPIFLKPSQLKILIIGGGNVAEEKLHFLLKSSPQATVTIIAPKVSNKVIDIVAKHQHSRIILREYSEEVISSHNIIIAATNNTDLNKVIWRNAKQKRILINVADTPELCDFYLGAIITKGDLKLAISTNGKSPTFAKRFREVLEEVLPDELPETLNHLHAIRKSLKGNFSKKVKELHVLTSGLTTGYERV
ncbi:MAG: bifunctional precorrin-2 dehydrogenase/sirohydrochlorin ferrochelatase [Cyclobacteriaceae bacterium]|nr:bifunctional precorrin-2 dehydrogenase/sirohydrochlorin ferrochelatase [Cyclobacteriaceae bacterium]